MILFFKETFKWFNGLFVLSFIKKLRLKHEMEWEKLWRYDPMLRIDYDIWLLYFSILTLVVLAFRENLEKIDSIVNFHSIQSTLKKKSIACTATLENVIFDWRLSTPCEKILVRIFVNTQSIKEKNRIKIIILKKTWELL